jgi:hypothetical protein
MKYTLALLSLVVAALLAIHLVNCFIPANCFDTYCENQCRITYGPEISYGEWHGNDTAMKQTRCGCFFDNTHSLILFVSYKEDCQ